MNGFKLFCFAAVALVGFSQDAFARCAKLSLEGGQTCANLKAFFDVSACEGGAKRRAARVDCRTGSAEAVLRTKRYLYAATLKQGPEKWGVREWKVVGPIRSRALNQPKAKVQAKAKAKAKAPVEKKEASSPGNPIAMNIALTNHYVWRGLSQSGGLAAVQGGADWAYKIGIVTLDVGSWGSNINYAKGVELDFYGGVGFDLFDGGSLRVGALHYTYFNELNFMEVPLSLSLWELSFGYAYDPRNKNGYASFGWDLMEGLGFSGGYNHFQEGTNYMDFRVAASRDYLGVTFEVAATFVTRQVDTPHGVVTLSKAF